MTIGKKASLKPTRRAGSVVPPAPAVGVSGSFAVSVLRRSGRSRLHPAPEIVERDAVEEGVGADDPPSLHLQDPGIGDDVGLVVEDRKSTRLNSIHANISYAVFCLKKNDTASWSPLTIRL